MTENFNLRLGVDLGNTIVNNRDPEKNPFDDAFRVIKRFVDAGWEMFIVSRVNPDQEIRSRKWLEDRSFFQLTGISKLNLYYCRERFEKALIAEDLNLTHFIDDRAEVLSKMPDFMEKLLYFPPPLEVYNYFNFLSNTRIVENWLEIEKLWLK